MSGGSTNEVEVVASDPQYDVAIVGFGPVGQLLSVLLGNRGFRVVVLERYEDPYSMPRAVHFDHEVGRILQSVGIRPDTNPIIEAYDNWYEWRNAEGKTLLAVDWRGVGPSWWHTSNFFSQPDLERELAARVKDNPSVTLRLGRFVRALDQDNDGVRVWTTSASDQAVPPKRELVTASYVIGCDGANSTIRNLLGIEVTDLGFFFDWLILDMVPHQPMTFDPPAWQLCDPKRPTTIVPGGPGRRRWEFMALPGEDIDELNKADTAWKLLGPWGVNPDNATMERHTVYRFQAHWANEWRRNRVLIAGDAAHLMPPFAGQGMCAGLRDACNLAWKLDLVLRGAAGEKLLDTYGSERLPHVRSFIDLSIELGKVICVPNEEEAAERDRQMIAAINDARLAPTESPVPRLGTGVLATDDPHAGLLSIQSRVTYRGEEGLFDDLVGRGWRVLTTVTDLGLPAHSIAVLERVGAEVLRIGPPAAQSVVDVVDLDGRYSAWMGQLNADTVVIRPDFYIYAATTAECLPLKLAELDQQLVPARHPTPE